LSDISIDTSLSKRRKRSVRLILKLVEGFDGEGVLRRANKVEKKVGKVDR
jgi:hypothetical protein